MAQMFKRHADDCMFELLIYNDLIDEGDEHTLKLIDVRVKPPNQRRLNFHPTSIGRNAFKYNASPFEMKISKNFYTCIVFVSRPA